MNDKTLVLTIDAKEKPLQWLDYMLRSASKFLDEDVKIVICTDSPSDVSMVVASIGARHTIDIHNVADIVVSTGLNRVSSLQFHSVNISPLQMYRLALPLDPYFSKLDRIVFCDVDVGFESHMWNRIFDEDVNGVDILAVRDCKFREDLTRERCNKLSCFKAFANVAAQVKDRITSGHYYAAGLMVMNLNHLRNSHGDYGDFLKRMIDVCIDEQLPQLDQSLINLYFSIREISPSYNAWTSNSREGMPVWMRHFPGPDKIRHNYYPTKGIYLAKNKVDVVYILGGKSEHEDIELKWSLRSIAKYGRNIGRVIVTSSAYRDWLANDVIQVDCQDMPKAGYKHHNILKAIINTIGALDLHGEFLVSSDDHFYLRETDFARYPFHVRNWNINKIPSQELTPHTSQWKISCSDTGDFLRHHNLPDIDFQGHMNAHWNADLVRDNLDLFMEAMRLPYCVEPHVLMQNLWLSKCPTLPLEYRHDAKIYEFSGYDGSIDCISCYDQTFVDQPFLDFMEAEFGEKCRYEK